MFFLPKRFLLTLYNYVVRVPWKNLDSHALIEIEMQKTKVLSCLILSMLLSESCPGMVSKAQFLGSWKIGKKQKATVRW